MSRKPGKANFGFHVILTPLRIHSNDVNNVATAAAAATTHLNNLTVNNSHNNITNTNIQAATAAASATVSLATQVSQALLLSQSSCCSIHKS